MHLSADYYPRVIELATGVTPAACIGFLLAVALGIAVRRAWRRAPDLAFALCWIPIAIAPTSNVLFPSVVLAERTLYLASAGACLAIGFLLQRIGRSRATPAIAALGLLIGVFAARTWTRTPVWKNDKSYIITLLREHPEAYRGHLVAGRVYARQGQLPEAAAQFETAYRLYPSDPAGAYEAAVAHAGMGHLAKADSLLSAAPAASPNSAQLMITRADIRIARQDFQGAILDARRALSLAPDSARAVVIIVVAARSAGLFTLADSTFRSGIAAFPEMWQLRLGYADLLLARGDSAAARVQAAAAVEQSNGDSAAVAMSMRARQLP
jgi:tetratricopeptide (TPR) repeat protein